MQPSHMSARSVLSMAVLAMAVVVAWRVSGGVSTLLHDMHLHLAASLPRPPAAPKVIPVPPKMAQIACHP